MTVPLSEIMRRLSAEINRAADLAVQVETTMDHGNTRRNQDLQNIQDLDLLVQTLVDLARFAHTLAPSLPVVEVHPEPAIESMTLRGLATRLSGDDSDLADTEQGEVCVF